MTGPATTSLEAEREIRLARLIDAPRARVFQAFTDPAQVVLWWGPDGFTDTLHHMEVRPGGEWRHTMHGPDGTDYPTLSRFVEVVRPDRLSFDHGTGLPGEPDLFRAVATFREEEGGTRVTLAMAFPTAGARQAMAAFGAVEGGEQTLARLEAYLTRELAGPPFVIRRTFKASRERVYRAWTEPEQLQRWWAPPGFALGVHAREFRHGGRFHYSMATPDGHLMWGRFHYRELVPSRLIVSLVAFSDAQGGLARHPMSATWPMETLHFASFTDEGGRTTLTLESFPYRATEEERATFRAGFASMTQGFGGTFNQLEAYLASLA